MDLSIIVPVYNVEKYLLKCVDSLLNQDLKDDSYEIILINDGSTDNSLDLCIKLQNHYPNIKLYNQSNQGVGAARNKGITEAQGRFIAFVDSDDYLLFGGLGRLINIIRDNPYVDIVHFLSDYDGRVLKDLNYNIDYMGAASFLLEKSGLPAFVWIYLYRKEFLIKNKIWFKNYKFSEDTLFISTVFLHNPYVISTQASIYRYVLREGSAITNNNRVHLKRVVEDNLSSYEDVLKELDLSIFKNSTKVYTACTKSINLKKISCYSRILQSCYSSREFRMINKRIRKNIFFPICPWNESRKVRWICKAINFSVLNFFTYWICSTLYAKIFVPLFLTHYRKKIWSTE